MDVRFFWKVLFTLYSIRPMLGCDVGCCGSQCQCKCRCTNDSWYSTDLIVTMSHCNEGRIHVMSALGHFPPDVMRNRYDQSEMDFTNKFNTCLANETVQYFDNMTIYGTDNKTIQPDLGYTFQVDHLGKVISICFNFTNHGESTNYDRLIVNITETTDIELDRTVSTDRNEMRVYLSKFTFTYGNVNSRIQNISGVTQAGNFQKFRIGQKDVQAFTLKQCDRSGNCFNLNENETISIWIIRIHIGPAEILIAAVCMGIFKAVNYWLKLRRRRNQLRANRLRRRLIHLASAAPAG